MSSARPALALAAIAALVSACTRSSSSIPPVDGPLALVVRYPTEAPIALGDSVATWGSVGSGRATLAINGRRVRVEPNGGFLAWLPAPEGAAPALEFVGVLGGDTVVRRLSLQRAAAAPPPSAVTAREAGGWVRVRRLPSDTADSATQRRPVFSRWFPGGPLAVPVPLGARLPVAARTEDAVRLRLADGVEVWVSAADVDSLVRPRRELVPLGPIHVTEREGMVELSVMAPEPLASTADIERNQFRWSIYGARHGSTAVDPARPSDFLRATERRNGPRGRADFVLRLAESPTGWRARWQDGRLVLQVRRPWPAKRGVAGLVVALDAGHPPAGATGPTGLREDSLTLAVARAAARKLAALGARPLLVRPDQRPLSLEARIARAEVANADLFVSIHVNAPADARPPALADGTETFFAQPFAERLAWALQDSVSAHMRQHWRDVTESDLAVLRATWFPAALVEGTCLVLPEREAWLRTPAGIDAYSSGIVAGVTRWVSETAGS